VCAAFNRDKSRPYKTYAATRLREAVEKCFGCKAKRSVHGFVHFDLSV
jgi:hypothetical protein